MYGSVVKIRRLPDGLVVVLARLRMAPLPCWSTCCCCHCRNMANQRELAGPVNTRELRIHCRVFLRGSRMVPVVGLVRRDIVVRHERWRTPGYPKVLK